MFSNIYTVKQEAVPNNRKHTKQQELLLTFKHFVLNNLSHKK